VGLGSDTSVVSIAISGIAEDTVGRVKLCKLFRGSVAVLVWMEESCSPQKGLSDVSFCGVLLEPENVVVVDGF